MHFILHNTREVQKHFRYHLFHGLCKQLHDSMCYLYEDTRIMYPHLMKVAHKAELEQEDWPREGVWVRSAQSDGKDGIAGKREQIVQLWVAVQGPQRTATSNSQQLGGVRNGNRNQHNTKGQGNNWKNHKGCEHNGIRGVVDASNLSPKMHNQMEGNQGFGKYQQTGSRIQVSQPWSLGVATWPYQWGYGTSRGVETMALVDTGSLISVLTEGFCTEMGLRILLLRNLIGGCVASWEDQGILIPYKGYIEDILTIPNLPWYN